MHSQRLVLAVYLGLIVAALVYFVVLGALHR
jgi:hypothetical protein